LVFGGGGRGKGEMIIPSDFGVSFLPVVVEDDGMDNTDGIARGVEQVVITFDVPLTTPPGDATLYIQTTGFPSVDISGTPVDLPVISGYDGVGGGGKKDCKIEGTAGEGSMNNWMLEGEWITPPIQIGSDGGNVTNSLRSGWIYSPRTCTIPISSQNLLSHLRNHSTTTTTPIITIAILGDSILRGIYLSLLDLLTPNGNGVMGKGGKCWGYYEVTVGRVKIVYQDYRRDHFGDCEDPDNVSEGEEEEEDTIICTGKKIASQSCLKSKRDAYEFLSSTLFKESVKPDLVVFNALAPNVLEEILFRLDRLDSTTTTKLAILRTPYGQDLFQPSNSPQKIEEERMDWTKELVKGRDNASYIDLTRLEHGMGHDMEGAPGMGKIHHHRVCGEGEIGRFAGIVWRLLRRCYWGWWFLLQLNRRQHRHRQKVHHHHHHHLFHHLSQ